MSGANAGINNIVLVHGAWVDGSGWEGVHRVLTKAGYAVSVTQHPTVSLADDVAVTRRAMSAHHGPVILVGHSYGGAVITEAGNDPNVAALFYVAGWVPDRGESVGSLASKSWPGVPPPPILPPRGGYVLLDKSKFHASFAGDIEADRAAFMADSQLPFGEAAFTGAITEPAWKSKPSWYIVTANDRMIAPDAQRAMASRARSNSTELAGSHAVYVPQAQAVADVIQQAARSVSVK